MMNETIYYSQRQDGYHKILKEIEANVSECSDFENVMKKRIFQWWANWKPDYEGWLKCADSLYADSCIIDAIGSEPQIYKDYRSAMKGQRDAFDMDMGPVQTCVVEGDTIAFNYKMYMTPKSDMGSMKKGKTIILKVSEFNTFANVENYTEPMVVHLQVIATGLES
jgi:hypothetical protein